MADQYELELPVQEDVVKAAKKRGWLHRRFEIKKGDPDDLFAKNGRVVLIEFKRPKNGRVAELQKIRHKEWRDAGIEVHVFSSREAASVVLS
jgi:hypothetical protein